MSKTDTLCPGIPTLIDDKNPDGIVHYLKIFDESTGNKLCDQSGCKFVMRDKNGNDVWQTDYMPATIK